MIPLPAIGVDGAARDVFQLLNWSLGSCATNSRDYEWAAIKPILPNKSRGVPRITSAGPYLRSMPVRCAGPLVSVIRRAPCMARAQSGGIILSPDTPCCSTRSHSEAEAMTCENPKRIVLGVLSLLRQARQRPPPDLR